MGSSSLGSSRVRCTPCLLSVTRHLLRPAAVSRAVGTAPQNSLGRKQTKEHKVRRPWDQRCSCPTPSHLPPHLLSLPLLVATAQVPRAALKQLPPVDTVTALCFLPRGSNGESVGVSGTTCQRLGPGTMANSGEDPLSWPPQSAPPRGSRPAPQGSEGRRLLTQALPAFLQAGLHLQHCEAQSDSDGQVRSQAPGLRPGLELPGTAGWLSSCPHLWQMGGEEGEGRRGPEGRVQAGGRVEAPCLG